MEDGATWWGPIAAGASFATAVGALGYYMDGKLDEGFRNKVREKLEGIGDDNWPTLFLTLFDRLFDPKGKGRPRLWRSSVVSILTVAALLAVIAVLLPESREALLKIRFLNFIDFVLVAVITNAFGDFLSIWESRIIINRMAIARNYIAKASYLFLDLIATVMIFYIASTIGVIFGTSSLNLLAGEDVFAAAYLEFLWKLALWGGNTPGVVIDILGAPGVLLFQYDGTVINREAATLFPVYFYTTLFTSVWVWLFMLGGVLWPLFKFLRGVLGVKKFPVGSAMAIGGVFGGLVTTVAGYVGMAIIS